MIYGNITLHSKRSAGEDIEFSRRVWCPDCLRIEDVQVEDYSFNDQFGCVTDFRVETECGKDPLDCITGCGNCGELVKPLHQVIYNTTELKKSNWPDDWFCTPCYQEYKNKLEGK